MSTFVIPQRFTETFKYALTTFNDELTIYYGNAANASRDTNAGWSFYRRFWLLVSQVNEVNPDIVVITEAGRSSVDENGSVIT